MNQQDVAPHENAARSFRDRNSLGEWDQAAERGRLMAQEVMKVDPEQRKLVESVYGITYCRNRYPEAYKNAK